MIQVPVSQVSDCSTPQNEDTASGLTIYQGQVLLNEGNLVKAIAHYRQLLIRHPHQASVHFQLGLAFDQHGDVASAIERYQRAVQLCPDHVDALNNLGCAFLKLDKIRAAINVLEQAIANHSHCAFLHNNLGRAQEANTQNEEALASYRHAIHLQPDFIQGYINLGLLWHRLNQIDEAIRVFQRVVELDPSSTQAYSKLAQWLMAKGDVAEVLKCWQHILHLHPERIRYFCDRILNSSHQSSKRDGLDSLSVQCAQFLRSLSVDGSNPGLSNQLADIYSSLSTIERDAGSIMQADRHLRTALNLNPNVLEPWLSLADCLIQQRHFDAAIAVCYLALHHHPNHPSLYTTIGSILECQDRPQKALAAYRQALTGVSPLSSAIHPSETHTRLATPVLDDRLSSSSSLPTHVYPSTQNWASSTTTSKIQYLNVMQPNDLGQTASPSQSAPSCSLPHASQLPCGGVTCHSCMASLRRRFQPLQIFTNGFSCTDAVIGKDVSIDFPPHPTFIVTLPNGRAWIAPQKNAWMICNSIGIMTSDGGLLSDLSRDYPWYLPGCDRHHSTQHQLFKMKSLPPVETIRGKVAVLSSLSGHVYYHWMMDILPRIELLRCSGVSLEDVDYYVVNSVAHPFQRETLSRLGIPLEKVITSDRHPHIQADQLIVPSFPGHLDWVPPSTLQFLRRTFLSSGSDVLAESQSDQSASHHRATVNRHVMLSNSTSVADLVDTSTEHASLDLPNQRYIYISRRRARYRHVINESELLLQLQPLGFIAIELEDFSVSQQASLFAQAERIVAPHGAGLTNLSFCQPGTQVVELVSPHYMRTDYWIVSHHLGLHHYVIRGQPFDADALRQMMYQGPLAEDIEIPIAALQSMIQHLKWNAQPTASRSIAPC